MCRHFYLKGKYRMTEWEVRNRKRTKLLDMLEEESRQMEVLQMHLAQENARAERETGVNAADRCVKEELDGWHTETGADAADRRYAGKKWKAAGCKRGGSL
jgi:hypothetical protein